MDTNNVDLNKQCKVCYENILDNFCLVSACCKSRFHHACLQECLNAQISNFNSVTKCPNFECGKDISDKDIQILDQNELELKKPQQQKQKPLSIKKKVQNCDICVEEMNANTFQALGCKDKYHKKCLEEYFKVEIYQKKLPIKCPNHLCQYSIQPSEIKQILEKQDYEKYEQFQLENYIDFNKSQVFQRCLTPNCEYLFIKEIEIDKFNCPTCYQEYCLVCQCKYHTSQSCKEYQMAENLKKLDEQFDNLVKDKKYKQCSKCQMYVEKNQGCNHMTCRCKYEFCYVCGGPYNQCECTKHVERVNQQQNANNVSRNASQQQRQQIPPIQIQPQQNNNQIIVQPSTNTNQIQPRQNILDQAMQQSQSQAQSNQLNQQTYQRNLQPANRNLNYQQIYDISQQIRPNQNNSQTFQLQNNANRNRSISQNRNQIQNQNNINSQQVKQQNQYNVYNFDRSPSQNRNQIQNKAYVSSPKLKQEIQFKFTNRDRSTSLNKNQIQPQNYLKPSESKQQVQLIQANHERSISQNRNQTRYQNYVKQEDVKQYNQPKLISRESSTSQQRNQIQYQNHSNSYKYSDLSKHFEKKPIDDDYKVIKSNLQKQQSQNYFIKQASNKQDELSKNIQNDNFSNNSGSSNKKIVTKNQSKIDLLDIKSNNLNESPIQVKKNTNHKSQMSLNINSYQKQIIEKQDYYKPSDKIQFYTTKNQNNQKFNLSNEFSKMSIAQDDSKPSNVVEKINFYEKFIIQNKENKHSQNQNTMSKTTKNIKAQQNQINQRLVTNFQSESDKIDESDEINQSL
ncbi:hypothetical protein ABPG74_016077 [Tetrahymena malaccensis]